MTTQTTTGDRQDRVNRAEVALERRHTRLAEQLAEQLVRDDPAAADGVSLLARAVAARGQIQRAVRLLHQAGAETDPDLSLILARILTVAGRLIEAREAYFTGLRQRPRETVAWLELAGVLRQTDDFNGAAEAYANAIRSDPLGQEGYLSLGELMQRAGAWDRAITVYREGLKVLPRSAELLCDLGAALLSTRQVDEAVESLSQSLSIRPVNDSALFNLGSALLERGDFKAAEMRFEQLLKLRPKMTDAWYKRSLCRRQLPEDAPVLEKLERLTHEGEDTTARAWFAMGKQLDDVGHHDRAYAAHARGNAIRAEQHAHDPAAASRLTDELIDAYDADLFQRLGASANRGKGLVYVVGLARSGLTLMEQILGAHSQIANLGDHQRLLDVKSKLLNGVTHGGYPSAISMLEPASIEAEAQRYQHMLPLRAPWVTDRTWSNPAQLGLIKLLFPSAKILMIERNIPDLALSMFFTDFSQGHGYSFDRQHIAAHCRDHQRLTGHWQSLWPDDIHVMHYEELIEDFDTTLNGVVQFLGLPFEAELRSFHQRRNAVEFTSAWSVRQPLFSTSIGRSKLYEGR